MKEMKVVEYLDVNICFDGINKSKIRFLNRTENNTPEFNMLKDIIKKTDIVLEVGGGLGIVSTYAGMHGNMCISYEGNPELIPYIEETYKLNNTNAIIKNAILSKSSGTVPFYASKKYCNSSILKHSRLNNPTTYDVECVEVNSEIAKYNPTILFMDCEGGEEVVKYIDFQDSGKTIENIIIEFHPQFIGDKSSSEIIKYLFNSVFMIKIRRLQNKSVILFYRNINTGETK